MAFIAIIVLAPVIFWCLLRLMHYFDRRVHKRLDPTAADALSKLIRIALFVVIALIVGQLLGMPKSLAMTLGGIAALAIGFAAQDLLANFFGALLLFFDRPFSVGDSIYIPDQDVEGTVEKIGWRMTAVRLRDDHIHYVPNGLFSHTCMMNHSHRTSRRINTTIALRYCDVAKLEALLEAIRNMLRAHPEIDQNLLMMCHLADFGPYALQIMVYAFTKTTNKVKFQQVQEDVLIKAQAIICAHGLALARIRHRIKRKLECH